MSTTPAAQGARAGGNSSARTDQHKKHRQGRRRVASTRHLAMLRRAARVCVVGSGPSGFYAAKYLLKRSPTVLVDLIDALPTPFGLVRSGVAPDHPEVKNVTEEFERVADEYGSSRFDFIGNCMVGRDVHLDTLRRLYDGVILAYGASSDRGLGAPGETRAGVLSARAFVNWYNGHPAQRDETFGALLDTEEVVVIGQGNVAVDCARVLAKTADELRSTDIAAHALEALAQSRVRRIHVVGRRGHIQAAFTMKELRELTRLESASLVVDAAELDAGSTAASLTEATEQRARKKIDTLLREQLSSSTTTAAASGPVRREVHLRFLLNPREFIGPGSPTALDRIQEVLFDRTQLVGEANRQRAEPTGETVRLPAGLALKSIGYASDPVPGLPFDAKRRVASNVAGRVIDPATGTPLRGLYCAGWLKRSLERRLR